MSKFFLSTKEVSQVLIDLRCMHKSRFAEAGIRTPASKLQVVCLYILKKAKAFPSAIPVPFLTFQLSESCYKTLLLCSNCERDVQIYISEPQDTYPLASTPLTKVQFVIIPLKHHLHIKRNQGVNMTCCLFRIDTIDRRCYRF